MKAEVLCHLIAFNMLDENTWWQANQRTLIGNDVRGDV